MSRDNWTVKDENGKEYWISRSVVLIPFVFSIREDKLYVLVEKRGKSVSHTNEWCCTCGYLDWDETFKEGCIREVMEETGITLSPDDIYFINYNDDPKESRQNIGMRFVCFVGHDVEPDMDKVITKDEVQEIKWLEIGELKSPEKIYIYSDKINPTGMKWAFGHNKLIPEVITKYYKIYQKNLVD